MKDLRNGQSSDYLLYLEKRLKCPLKRRKMPPKVAKQKELKVVVRNRV